MSAPATLPIVFQPEPLLDERVQVEESYTFEHEFEEPVRGAIFLVVEGCGLETRVYFDTLSNRVILPIDYYKPAYFQARAYIYTFASDALRRLRVTASGTGELRVRLWRASIVYRVESIPAGLYRLAQSAEALEPVERIIELPTDPQDQYKIIYEYEPGILAGIEGAYPWTLSTVVLQPLDDNVTILRPAYGIDAKLTPCTDKWSSTVWPTVLTTTIARGEERPVLLFDYRFWFAAWYSGTGRLRIVEYRLRPTAKLVQLLQ